MCELGRIQDHLLSIGAAALDLGAFTGFLYGFNERERIYDIVEYLSGQRFHPDWTRLGGAWRDIADEDVFKTMVKDFIRTRLPRAQKDLETLLNRNRIFVDRVQGVGVISAKDAVACSLSGPAARASGVKQDQRKDDPYLCYEPNWDSQGASPVDFDVVIATDGDCLSRYLVRLEEMRQSVRIIEQLIDNIPSGPIDTLADSKARIPDQADVFGSIEGTIQLFELIMNNRGIEAPVGEFYGSIDSPNGELGYYIVADGTKCPWRVRTRPPSFLNFSVLPRLVEGHLISDVVAVIGSLNIIAAELDR
jgi:NADH-quinone oxidoreductase subunit D